MSDFTRIERLIREARVQRSAMLGMAIGNFLGSSWQLAARAAHRLATALRGTRTRPGRGAKPLPAR